MRKEPIGSFRNKMPYGSVLRFSGKGVFVRIQMLSVLAFSAAASADSLVVGLSYGLRKIKVDWKSNLVVALLSLAGTVCSMILGRMLLPVLPDRFENVLGGGIIMGIGLFSLLRPWFSQKDVYKRQLRGCHEQRTYSDAVQVHPADSEPFFCPYLLPPIDHGAVCAFC